MKIRNHDQPSAQEICAMRAIERRENSPSEVIINMTPHPVNILDAGGKEIATFPISGKEIRLASFIMRDYDKIAGIPTTQTFFRDPEGLPEYKKGTFYIVSQLIKSALPDRWDLLVPAEVMRDNSGNIVGCQSLGR